jgi:tryptophan-rich sensory protein
MKRIYLFLLSIALCFSTAYFGSKATTPSIDSWYQSLSKPFFNPPNWIFAPVWTLLFFLMAISFYLILTEPKRNNKGIVLFILQLIFNFLWSYSFFFLHNPLLAFIDILILIALVILTYRSFSKINKTSGLLLLPYITWISFASILNLAIVLLN